MSFLVNESVSTSLISFIKKKIDLTIENSNNESTEWTLYVMTCYITKEGLRFLFKELREQFEINKNINSIQILVDKDEWAKLFYFQEQEIIEELKRESINHEYLNISVEPVDANSKLFHAKSYALVNKDTVEGFVIITSANLTRSGLTDNLEICTFSDDSQSVNDYLSLFQKIQKQFALTNKRNKELHELAEAYTILSMGTFYKKKEIKDTKCPIFLNEKGQSAMKSKENVGGDKVVAENIRKKISYRLVDYIKIKNLLPSIIPSSVFSEYSIDTPIGRWIPQSVHDFINNRISTYKEIYINFMKEKYFNDVFLENEKNNYITIIKENLKKKEYMSYAQTEDEDNSGIDDAAKNNFIDEYTTQLERMTNTVFQKGDDQSILNIFLDYEQSINIKMLSKPLVISILRFINQEIETDVNVSEIKKFNAKSVKKTRNINALRSKIQQMRIDLKTENMNVDYQLFNRFEEEQIEKLNDLIDSLKINDIFSAVILNQSGGFDIICGCTVVDISIELSTKRKNIKPKIKSISYLIQNDKATQYLLRENIKLLHKFNDRDMRFLAKI